MMGLGLLALAAALTNGVQPQNAQPYDDVATVQLLSHRADALTAAFTQAAGADVDFYGVTNLNDAVQAYCMTELIGDSEVAGAAVSGLGYILGASMLVTSPDDKALIRGLAVDELARTLQTVSRERTDAKRIAGLCPSSALIGERAQAFVGLMTDADAQLSAIKARLDR